MKNDDRKSRGWETRERDATGAGLLHTLERPGPNSASGAGGCPEFSRSPRAIEHNGFFLDAWQSTTVS